MKLHATIAAGRRVSVWAVAAAVVVNALCSGIASAQFGTGLFGQATLPEDDFTWTWGKRSGRRGIEDFSVLGNEGGFRCDLKGKLSFGSRLSRMDIRQLESDLRGEMQFVRAAANAMNDLQAQGALDWATLECVKPKREE